MFLLCSASALSPKHLPNTQGTAAHSATWHLPCLCFPSTTSKFTTRSSLDELDKLPDLFWLQACLTPSMLSPDKWTSALLLFPRALPQAPVFTHCNVYLCVSPTRLWWSLTQATTSVHLCGAPATQKVAGKYFLNKWKNEWKMIIRQVELS